MSNIPSLSLHANQRFATLIDILKEIRDPRINRRKRHPIVSILMIAICAIIGSANNFVAIEQFGLAHMDWFSEFLDLPFGIPSHDTFSRVFSLLDNRELSEWLFLWLEDCDRNIGNLDCVSMDGKVIKARSYESPLAIMRAWASKRSIVLGQVRISPDSNEITAIPKLLNILQVKGKIITIDAIGTQKSIVEKIIDKGADYVLPVKGNQHQFHQDLKLYLNDICDDQSEGIEYTVHETIEKNHGRFEKRKCWATSSIEWLNQRFLWKGLLSISIVETEILYKNGTIFKGRRYFISSLPADAYNILRIVRSHWSIENKLHWILDVVLDEDRSTIRKGWGAQNIATIKSLALSLLQRYPSKFGMEIKRNWANASLDFLAKVLLNPGF